MLVWASLAALLAARAAPSEFPERECCDAVYPLAAVSASILPDTPTPPPSTTIRAGDDKGGVETLNCLLARQLCFEDPSCSPILETIPRVCGPESVSCSTVTVTKCQAALRTLQAFPFFKPTCLCREPQVDHECNSFRNFLFDHPCIFVLKKEKDPYPIDALPTCTHALSVCTKDEACQQIYDYFKTHCKVRDGKCHMEDRELCHEAWTKIRLTPMFGCICPNNHMKKRCERIVSLVNHNPCIALGLRVSLVTPFHTPWLHADRAHDYSHQVAMFSKESPYHTTRSGQKSEENSTLSFKNTCDKALYSCKGEPACKTALAGVTDFCSSHKCRRHSCMNALQNFYRTVDPAWSLEIAFCLCKKTKNNKDECLVAQELLHPVCAQQPETNVLPTCHSLAQACNQDTHCRLGLENYVQACAVDAVSKQCAGPAKACRSAMLGILGTMLRSNCACKGTDFSQIYDCMGWQRVLWFNPCVVESQRDFHAKKIEGLSWNGNNRTRVVGVMSGGGQPTWGTTSGSSAATTEGKPSTTQRTTVALTTQPSTSVSTTTTTTTKPTTTSSTTVTTTTTTTTKPSTTTTTTPTTTTTSTTERPTLPSRHCVFQKPDQQDRNIADNDGQRLYREGEPDCSDVCLCHDGSLTCNTICVERHPCKTDFAFYNHAAPAYQAYRGRCLCYSGKFICMRPPPDTYDVPPGVFLFLGYSDVDEARLKPLIKMQVEDAVAFLQKLLREHVKPKTPCMLSLYNISSNTENVILVAKLTDNNSTLTQSSMTMALLNRQKEECLGPLQEISDMINSQDPIVHSNLLLSIFKMAEVEVKYPPGNTSNILRPSSCTLTLIAVLHYLYLSISS